MQRLPLGRTGLDLPRIGLGGAPLGREIDEAASRAVLDHALARGVTLIDTAESYGGGNAREYRRRQYGVDDVREASHEMHSSEKIIGRWQRDRGCRDRIQLLTKFSSGGRPEQVRAALQGSLERLQTDRVDIYMLHQPYPDVPIRETLEALDAEVRAGRIGSVGCSNFTAAQLREAQACAARHGLARIEAVQPPFSLADAGAARELLPYCRREQIAAITYSPLAAGFLTGKYAGGRDAIPKGTRFDVIPGHIDVYFSAANFRVVRLLQELAAETGVPVVRLAMAWVFHHPGVTCVLVGARTNAHLDNAFDALAHELSPALKARMDAWLD